MKRRPSPVPSGCAPAKERRAPRAPGLGVCGAYRSRTKQCGCQPRRSQPPDNPRWAVSGCIRCGRSATTKLTMRVWTLEGAGWAQTINIEGERRQEVAPSRGWIDHYGRRRDRSAGGFLDPHVGRAHDVGKPDTMYVSHEHPDRIQKARLSERGWGSAGIKIGMGGLVGCGQIEHYFIDKLNIIKCKLYCVALDSDARGAT